jgi:hypothetical protein
MTVADAAADGLRHSWQQFCELLRTEGEAVLDAGAANDQELAESLHLIARVGGSALQGRLEFVDSDFPVFYRSGDDRVKSGFQNVDNTYMHAQLHGDASYRLHGEPNGREFALTTFEGDYSRILPQQKLGERWSDEIVMQSDGSFDMILSAAEQPGNWLPLRPGVPCLAGLRQYFIDWNDRSIPGFFWIDRIDGPNQPRPLNSQRLISQLDDARGWLERSLGFWSGYGNLRTPRPETVNMVPSPTVTSASTSKVAYGIGQFDLAPDQALLIEIEPPDTRYWGFNIYNIWGGAPDFQNRQSSLNSQQVYVDSDTRVRLVVSHRDPGHPNWLDTEGNRRGVIWYRWFVFPGEAPAPISTVVPVGRLWDYVPADTPRIAEAERRTRLLARREHIARRFQR